MERSLPPGASSKLSANAKLERSLSVVDFASLSKEERLARRKASMTAGDSWEDLHGTKDRPGKEVSLHRARQLAELAAAHGEEDPHFAAAVDWSPSTSTKEASTDERWTKVSDGAGPSSVPPPVAEEGEGEGEEERALGEFEA